MVKKVTAKVWEKSATDKKADKPMIKKEVKSTIKQFKKNKY